MDAGQAILVPKNATSRGDRVGRSPGPTHAARMPRHHHQPRSCYVHVLRAEGCRAPTPPREARQRCGDVREAPRACQVCIAAVHASRLTCARHADGRKREKNDLLLRGPGHHMAHAQADIALQLPRAGAHKRLARTLHAFTAHAFWHMHMRCGGARNKSRLSGTAACRETETQARVC